jgi:hypothetical protein
MPSVTGDRFSSQNMSDCEFCPPGGRRFRTTRQCATCSRSLCLVCRPWVPRVPFLCPECGGGPAENAIHDPAGAIRKIEQAGQSAPYWLEVLRERAAAVKPEEVEELIVPE